MLIFALWFIVSSNTPAPASPPRPRERAWQILKSGVIDNNTDSRAKAIHALGLLTTHEAQPLVETALAHSDKIVRSEAATALGKMHAVTARAKLHACLDDKEVLVVLACTNSLYLLKDPMAYEVYYALLTEERKSSKGLVKSQLDTLRDKKQIEKLAFETGIGFVPYGGVAWQAIQTVTHDDASPVRALAAERLASDPDPRSAKALEDFVADKKIKVREAVIEAIAKRGDPKLLPSVTNLLNDENLSIRDDAAAAVICLTEHHAIRQIQPNVVQH
jgi:HEAT repeat protein